MCTNQRIQQLGSRAWGSDSRTVRNKLTSGTLEPEPKPHCIFFSLLEWAHQQPFCHVAGLHFPVCSNHVSEATSKEQGRCRSHSLIVYQAHSQGLPLGLVTVSTGFKGAYFPISIPCCQRDRNNEVLFWRTQRQPCIKYVPFFDPVSQILLFGCQGSHDRRPVSCRGWARSVSAEDRCMCLPVLGKG